MEMRDRIKMIRKKAGLTQAEFSATLGLSPTSAAAWEKKDAQIPTESMQLLICKTFNINKQWLETGEGDMDSKPNKTLMAELSATYKLTALECDIIQAFLDMDPDQQKVFLEMARALKK